MVETGRKRETRDAYAQAARMTAADLSPVSSSPNNLGKSRESNVDDDSWLISAIWAEYIAWGLALPICGCGKRQGGSSGGWKAVCPNLARVMKLL